MATGLKLASNANNAALSTGPRTSVGKARARQNALRHGLRAEVPVLPGERAEDWEAHRDSILQSLAPAGGMEIALAERVALSLWRLNRVATYETAITALGMLEEDEAVRPPAVDPDAGPVAEGVVTLADRLAAAEQQLQQARHRLAGCTEAGLLDDLPDRPADAPVSGEDAWDTLIQLWDVADQHYDAQRLPYPSEAGWLAALGVPEDQVSDAFEKWSGWTAGLVRLGWQRLAAAAGVSPDVLLARVVADRRQDEADTRERIRGLEKAVKDLRRQVELREQRRRQGKMLPDEATLNKVTRYEAHLSRQMLQALHTLERLQAARAGLPVPPPAALDVTVDAPVGPSAIEPR